MGRKKSNFNNDCKDCERKDKRVEHLERQLAKYKKQITRFRQRMNELDYLAREVEFIQAKQEIRGIEIFIEDDESKDKPECFDDKITIMKPTKPVTQGGKYFNVKTGRMEDVPKELPEEMVEVPSQDKLSYSKCKKIEKTSAT